MNTQTIAIIVSITGVGAVLLAAIVPLLVVVDHGKLQRLWVRLAERYGWLDDEDQDSP